MVHLSVIYMLAIRGLLGFMHTYGVHLSPSVQSWRSESAGNRNGARRRLQAQRGTPVDGTCLTQYAARAHSTRLLQMSGTNQRQVCASR